LVRWCYPDIREAAMSYVLLRLPRRARPHANEAQVTKNILRIDQNEAKHKSLMFCFVVQQTNLIGQLGGYRIYSQISIGHF